MKTLITRSALLLLSVAFVGCAGTQSTSPKTSEIDTPPAKAASSSSDHHEGEVNVPEHDDSPSSASHIDDPNKPAHGHSSSHDDSNEPPHRD